MTMWLLPMLSAGGRSQIRVWKRSFTINARRGKLRQLTAKSNKIELFMEDACNLDDIETKQFKVYKSCLKNLLKAILQCCWT